MHFIKFDRFYFWGPIIRDILENIENLRSKNDKGKKVKIYSGVIFKKSNKFQYLKSSAFFSMIQLLYRFFHFSVLIMFISHHLQVLSSLTFISKVSSHFLSFSPSRFPLSNLDDNTYLLQLKYLNMTNGETAHIVQLPGRILTKISNTIWIYFRMFFGNVSIG